ncbi:hypothetical protein CANTEDRAFT_116900 [Yamadazyma tenuis ATCC 10573]|uniref:Uncharacterized protein n=2 Tax=Candida tenuis TaxID=2315449 RepID=G3BCH1_CANTC|nr:uncharacterized protein CANTEDRAFT_116900 [Yamadazyma tenuis ATCC 10573]XP_006690491.1 uncharacterized protein CANTEDRAFT_116900 [Yamadazyma tenuis ATCC 10573]EGV61276.1 hypothetical protein CANTEDRAFT_116900 [Yamadazyma tenuis ATCC 10573]EGV61277.1 hypothetical protein CANTEDRAFT_116900 [Yamadazyma tenuis ATCC 10573]
MSNTNNKESTAEQQQQMDELFNQLKGSIDKQKYPQFEEYIDSTHNYLANVMKQMEQTDDKDRTSKEIADDLSGKLNKWLESKQKELETQQKKQESKPQTEEK